MFFFFFVKVSLTSHKRFPTFLVPGGIFFRRFPFPSLSLSLHEAIQTRKAYPNIDNNHPERRRRRRKQESQRVHVMQQRPRRRCEGTAMGAIVLDLRPGLGIGPFSLGTTPNHTPYLFYTYS